jgi:fibronectin-binding autotransporter adhesin
MQFFYHLLPKTGNVMSNKTSLVSFAQRILAASTGVLLCLQTSAALAATPVPTNLNLGSTQHNIISPYAGVIHQGNTVTHITAGQSITPAELAALAQVVTSGSQTLVLGTAGNAVGGRLNVSADISGAISGLSVPKGVTALENAGQNGLLNISGAINNAGNIFAFSSNSQVNQATINALSLTNQSTGIISTIVPTISGINSQVKNLDLILNITNSLVNSGSISSAGNLSISTSNITNQGLIQATGGNINFTAADGGNFVLNNTGGSISALNGSINIRDASFTANQNLTITGGNLQAQNFNLYSGTGNVNVDVGELIGPLNITAGAAHITAATPLLVLGNMQLSGDPTFFNTNGSVVINSPIALSGASLAIIASQDVTGTSNGSISATTAGSNVLVISGAQFSVSPASASSSGNTSGQGCGSGDTSSTLTVTGGDKSGGLIDLHNLSQFSTTTSSGQGGNVTLLAFAGTGTNSGTINANVLSGIQTSGGGGPNGDVVMIAGATSGTGIITGIINTAGSASSATTGTTGQILLATATPLITQPLVITNGNINEQNNGSQVPTPNDGAIAIGALQHNSSITVGSLTTNQAPVNIFAGSTVTLGGGITTGGVPAVGAINPGGVLQIVAGGNIQSSSGAGTIDTSAGSNGGTNGSNILIAAGASFTPSLNYTFGASGANTTQLSNTITGASATGGSILLNGGGATPAPITGLNTFASSGGFAGGNVQLLAFAGSATASGQVQLPAAVTVMTGGSSNGNSIAAQANPNGNVTILAGGTSGTTIQVGSINTTGSNAGAGNITIETAGPTAGLPLVFTNGALTSGTVTPGALQNASATVGTLTAEGGTVQLPPPGNLATTATTAVNVEAGNNLTIGSVTNANNMLPSSGDGIPTSTINLQAGGVMTFSSGATISASASMDPNNDAATSGLGTNGGTITITAQSFTSSGMINVAANGAEGFNASSTNGLNGGGGGTISITSTGKTGSTITVGGSAGNFAISAIGDPNGGNAGTVSLNSATNLAINTSSLTTTAGPNTQFQSASGFAPSPLLSTGNGAIINLTAGSTVAISGTLDASGAVSTLTSSGGTPGGNGGSITIVMNSSSQFNIGSATAGANGVSGGVLSANGNNTNTSSGGIASFGSGGSISVTNLGTGGVFIGAVNLPSGSTTVAIQVQAAPAVDASSAPTVGGLAAGLGGNIVLQGSQVFSAGALHADGGAGSNTFGSGSGGTISITTNSSTPFIIDSSSNSALTSNGITTGLSAAGNGSVGMNPTSPAFAPTTNTGNGGSITVTNNGSGGIFIGTEGSISVAAAAANSTLETLAGNGGTISLNAPAGKVLSLVSLDASGGQPSVMGTSADGGNGGTISIASSSGTTFAIGAPNQTLGTGNGITGTLTANGFNGGTISITNLGGGKTTGGISVGANALSVMPSFTPPGLQGTGGSGGNIALLAQTGPISIIGGLNVNAAGATDSPATITNGGAGGSILITSNSAITFTATSTVATTAPTNGSGGPLSALGGAGIAANGSSGSVTITNLGKGGITTTDANAIVVSGQDATTSSSAGSGGAISLQAPAGPVSITGGLNANGGAGNITENALGFAPGFAGSISIAANSSSAFTIGTGGTGTLSATGYNGGSVTIINLGNGGITAQSAAIDVSAAAGSALVNQLNQSNGGNGGNISLQAPNGPVLITASLSANGGAAGTTVGGNGGQISIVSNSTQAFNVGGAVANGVSSAGSVSANGVNGGIISITNNGTGGLIVTPSVLSVTASDATSSVLGGAAGNGGSLNLQAPKGNVFINGPLSVNGGGDGGGISAPGNGGTISIVSNSKTAFNLGGTTASANGITGALSAMGSSLTTGSTMLGGGNGGSIAVTNLGTGGVIFTPSSVVVTATSGNGGVIDLEAPGGTLSNSAAGSLNANAAAGNSGTGGTITLAASTISNTAGVLSLNATGDPTAGNSGQGGAVIINQTSTTLKSPLSVGGSSNLPIDVDGSLLSGGSGGIGGSISITSAAGIFVLGGLSSSQDSTPHTGTINLTTSGSGNIITGSGTINSDILNLVVGSGSAGSQLSISPGLPTLPIALSTAVRELTFTANGGSAFLDNLGPITINSAVETTKGSFTLNNTNGAVTVSGPIFSPGAVSIEAQQSPGVTSIMVNGSISGQTVSLSSDQVSGSGVITASASQGITINAGVGGVNINTATGLLTLNVAGTAGTTNVTVNNEGNLSLKMGTSANINNLTITNDGSLITTAAITMANAVSLSTTANSNFNLILGGSIGAGVPGSSVTLIAGGSIIQSPASSGNVIQADTVTLSSTNGNLGTSSTTPLQVNATTALNVLTTNAGGAFINNLSNSVTLGNAQTAGDFQLTTAGNLTIGSGNGAVFSSQFGAMSFISTSSTGTITVNNSISANGGTLLIQNSNASGATAGTETITVANNLTLAGNGRIMDNNPAQLMGSGVALVNGTFPTSALPTTPPANVTVNAGTSNNAFFDSPTNVAVPTGTATVNATGANVIMVGSTANGITLGSGVTVNALATVQALSSLDLTNKTEVAALVALQKIPTSGVGGTLTVSGGVATGGTLIIQSSVSLIDLTGLIIPAKVAVTLDGFGPSAPVVVNVQSPTKNSSVGGTLQFMSAGAPSGLFINSGIAGNVLTVSSGAQLTSDNSLTLAVSGGLSVAGTLSATGGNLSIFTGNVAASTTTANSAGTVSLTGTLSAGAPSILGLININASGSILQTAGSITASSVALEVGGANASTAPGVISLNSIAASSLSLTSSSGSAMTVAGTKVNVGTISYTADNSPLTINQTAAFSLGGTSLGTVTAQSSTAITVSELSCATCSFTTPSMTITGEISNSSPGGTVTIAALKGGSLAITAPTGSSPALISAGTGLTISGANISIDISGGNFETASGALNITATKAALLQDVGLLAGTSSNFFGGLGTLTPANILSGGSVNVTAASGGISVIGSDNFVQTFGGNINVIAKGSGGISLQGIFEAEGGNIVVLAAAAAAITGGNANFTANAVGTDSNNSVGGGVELGAGLTTGTLSSAFNLAPGTVPGSPAFLQPAGPAQVLGSNVLISNTIGAQIPTGAVVQNTSGGGFVNLSTIGVIPTTLTLQGGAVVFDAVGKNASVQLDSSMFSVSSFRPIGFTQSYDASNVLVMDSGDDFVVDAAEDE